MASTTLPMQQLFAMGASYQSCIKWYKSLLPAPHLDFQGTANTGCHIRPEFFYFSFYRPSQPNFLGIVKKKEIFFQFYFFISLRLMPVQYWSSVMFFGFVFSIAARLIKLPPVTAPGEILPF